MVTGIIPARYESSDFLGNLWLIFTEKACCNRWSTMLKSQIRSGGVATDDERTEHVAAFGGKVILTNTAHQWQSIAAMQLPNWSTRVLWLIFKAMSPSLTERHQSASCLFWKLKHKNSNAIKIKSAEILENPNCPKVVLNTKGEALYFSRAVTPHLKNVKKEDWQVKYIPINI